MMDDVTYLTMKLFKENQQWIWQHSTSNFTHLYTFIVIWLSKEIWMLELFLFEIDVEEKKRHKERERERKKKGDVQELLLLILLFTKH